MPTIERLDRLTFLVGSHTSEDVSYLVDLQGAKGRPECGCPVFDFYAPICARAGLPPPVCTHIWDLLEALGVCQRGGGAEPAPRAATAASGVGAPASTASF